MVRTRTTTDIDVRNSVRFDLGPIESKHASDNVAIEMPRARLNGIETRDRGHDEHRHADLALIERKHLLDDGRYQRATRSRAGGEPMRRSAPHMRAAATAESRDAVALELRTEGAVVLETGIVAGEARREPCTPEGAVVTTKRSGVVTTATRQQLRGAAVGFRSDGCVNAWLDCMH